MKKVIQALKKKYDLHFMKIEFFISIVVTLIIIIIINANCQLSDLLYWIINKKGLLYPTIASITGAMIGFIIATISIIIAFNENPQLKELKKSKEFHTMFDIYINSVYYLSITTIITIIGILIDTDASIFIFNIFIWSIIISFFRIARCIWILKNIIDIVFSNPISQTTNSNITA